VLVLLAQSKLNGVGGATYRYGCNYCMIGSSRILNRQVFAGYRAFLEEEDFLRTDPTFGPPEHRSPPPLRVSIDPMVWDSMSHAAKKQIRTATGVSDICAFHVLPYWNTTERSRLDAMHLFKGITKHIFYLAKGKRQPKGDVGDSELDRLAETRTKLDRFRLSPEQQSAADERFVSVRGPSGFLARTQPPFAKTSKQEMLTFVPTFVGQARYRLVIGRTLRSTWLRYYCGTCLTICTLSPWIYWTACTQFVPDGFSSRTSVLCACESFRHCMCDLVNLLRCRFEHVFPVTEHVLVFHNVLHLMDSICLWGPVCSYWMYSFERYFGFVLLFL
jgi:hypothetical protein